MVIFTIHIATFIYVIRSLMKCIWSIYWRYGHNTFEILLYYMINNRVIWLYGYMVIFRIHMLGTVTRQPAMMS